MKQKYMFFLELSFFFDDPTDVGNLISGSSVFPKTSLNIWMFTVHVFLKPGLENFEHYFTSVWDLGHFISPYSMYQQSDVIKHHLCTWPFGKYEKTWPKYRGPQSHCKSKSPGELGKKKKKQMSELPGVQPGNLTFKAPPGSSPTCKTIRPNDFSGLF